VRGNNAPDDQKPNGDSQNRDRAHAMPTINCKGGAVTEFLDRYAKRAAPFIAALYCVLVTGSIVFNYVFAAKFGNDFGVYWRAAHQPVGQVYFWKGRFPFPYAPTMLLWIAPLALIPKWIAYFLFVGSSIIVFALACRPYLRLPAIALTLISPPVARGLFTGQVCAALAALVIWACGTANRVAAGVAFGIVASIKPQMVVMAPLMFALNRDWRAFAASAATFLGLVVLSLIMLGPARWPEWLASMNHFYHTVADTGVITIGTTPAAVAERLGWSPVPFLLLGAFLGATIVYLCREFGPLEKAAAISLGSIMSAPYALAYDLTVVMPLLALAIFQGRLLPAIGIATPYNPLPLIISTYELIRKTFPRSQSGAPRKILRRIGRSQDEPEDERPRRAWIDWLTLSLERRG
jgi:hypothetical protein